MLRARLILVAAISTLLSLTVPPVSAQQPAGTTSAVQGLIVQRALSLDMADAIVRGAVDQCRANGFRVSVSVIDGGGLLKAFMRDEGTGPHTIELSRDKAYAALTFHNRWATTLEAASELGYLLGSPMPNVEGASLLGGGVPIRVGTEVIGAVGVSGAVGGANDEICADAGIAAVAHLLQ